jgi:hypothetical protein
MASWYSRLVLNLYALIVYFMRARAFCFSLYSSFQQKSEALGSRQTAGNNFPVMS